MSTLPTYRSGNTKFNKHLLPYLAIVLATIIWSGAVPIIKLTEQYIPPFSFLMVRLTLVCAILLPFMAIQLKKHKIPLSDLNNLVILGFLGQSSLAIIFLSLKYAVSIDVAIIGAISPVLAIAGGHYFYKEKINKIVMTGIILASLGTFVIVLEPLLANGTFTQAGENRLLGNILAVIYNLAFTLYVIFSKIIMGKKSHNGNKLLKAMHITEMKKSYSPALHTAFTFYVGLLTVIPLAILENRGVFGSQTFDISNLTTTPLLGILYMAFFSSIVAYMAFEWGLKTAQVTDSAIFGYLGPIFTIPFAYLLLGETLTPATLTGALIIALGVVIAEKNKT